MAEFDVPPQIDQIRTRLKGTDIAFNLYAGAKAGVKQRLMRNIFGEPSRGARSENTATAEQIKEVQDKADSVRRWLIEQNQRFNPEEVEEFGNDGWIYDEGDFELYTDDSNDAVDPSVCTYLSLTENFTGKNAEAWFVLGMHNTYTLEITYKRIETDRQYVYQSGEVPIDQMSDQDYIITKSMLDNFMVYKNIQIQPPDIS